MIDIEELNINRLNAGQLMHSNARIVERLRQLDAMSTLQSMTQPSRAARLLRSGRDHQDRPIIKFNQKRVMVLADDNQRWKISLQLLMRVIEDNSGGDVRPIRCNTVARIEHL